MEGLAGSACAIRPLVPGDVAAATAIAAVSPEAGRWLRSDFDRAQSAGWDVWVAEMEGAVAGFLIARRAADEVEILTVAVGPAFRRRGVGGQLLEAALARANRCGARTAFLEVRPSNAPARAFYERHGFVPTGPARSRYYFDPVEDALVLSRALPPASI